MVSVEANKRRPITNFVESRKIEFPKVFPFLFCKTIYSKSSWFMYTGCKTIPAFDPILNLKRIIHLREIKKKVARK